MTQIVLRTLLIAAVTSLCAMASYGMPSEAKGTALRESKAKAEAAAANQRADNCAARRYVFSWNLSDHCAGEPRGGTSVGAPLTLDLDPSESWLRLQQPGLSDLERDRRAILAMAGGYRASFEFLETVGYAPDFEPARPYQSWGTEYIYVVEDSGDFISLQHIMVMFFQQDDDIVGPMVMKHWRQDWQYQDSEILEYRGDNRWQTRKVDKSQRQGSWSQHVYHVDDSPRYASVGRWEHNDSFSVWESGLTWRPLPRRESSVRNDYDLLEGINRHIILPTGWVQEEDNRKRRLGESPRYLAKELGNNRYQRIKDFDWQAGDDYWRDTAPFWKVVREYWQARAALNKPIELREAHKGTPMFAVLFGLAEQYREEGIEDLEKAVAEALAPYSR